MLGDREKGDIEYSGVVSCGRVDMQAQPRVRGRIIVRLRLE